MTRLVEGTSASVRAVHSYRAAMLLVVVGLLLLTACGAPGRSSVGQPAARPTATLPAKWNGVDLRTGMPTVTPPASLSPRPLPAFSDPRVAYIGPDSLLHVVSLDGRMNLAGTPIPLAGFAASSIACRCNSIRYSNELASHNCVDQTHKQIAHRGAIQGLIKQRVLAVENISGVPRHELRPDLYPEPVEARA